MNKKITSFEEFERVLKDEHIPIQTNQKLQVLRHINISSKRKPKFFSSVTIFISLCLVFTVTVAAAVEFTGLTFFNKDKASVLEIKTMTEEEMPPHLEADKIDKKNRALFRRLKKTIPPGKLLKFLDVEIYEESGSEFPNMFTLYNKGQIDSVEQISSDFSGSLNLQNSLIDRYELKNGSIYYKIPQTDVEELIKMAEEMVQQAKQDNKHYAVLEGDLLSEIDMIDLQYGVPGSFDSMDIGIRSIGNQITTSQDISSYKKIIEDGYEYYFSETNRELLFVQEGQKENYLISIRDTFIPVEGDNFDLKILIEIAKSLMNVP